MASIPQIRMTAMLPVPNAVDKATIVFEKSVILLIKKAPDGAINNLFLCFIKPLQVKLRPFVSLDYQ
jgi:hypothetical protein